uniref:50S ribosomal protein L34 n=1 Tax=Steinernema glaseri TaxID=37863 RepID=A0A1I7Y423_9BILA
MPGRISPVSIRSSRRDREAVCGSIAAAIAGIRGRAGGLLLARRRTGMGKGLRSDQVRHGHA